MPEDNEDVNDIATRERGVVRFLRMWVSTLWRDFEDDVSMKEMLFDFLMNKLTSGNDLAHQKWSESLLFAISNVKEELHKVEQLKIDFVKDCRIIKCLKCCLININCQK
jgi:hypothetical protein